jgi:hypothetical protein
MTSNARVPRNPFTVEDTSKRDPLAHLVGMMGEGSSDYITGMERSGQVQLVNSSRLPTERYGSDEDWRALGFTFGPPDPADSLFCDATLPPGWSKAAGEHSMGSYICDERGIQRVSVFYKAAFYDRKASMSLLNVGYDLASKVAYGDGEVVLPAEWSLLTDAEQADFVASLEGTAADAYSATRPSGVRAKAALKLVQS